MFRIGAPRLEIETGRRIKTSSGNKKYVEMTTSVLYVLKIAAKSMGSSIPMEILPTMIFSKGRTWRTTKKS